MKRGKKIHGEEGVDWWVRFKYERLPNFCYRCGLLEHDLKDCTQKEESDKNGEMGELQYGAWMRGEPVRSFGWDSTYPKRNGGMGTRGSIPDDKNQMLKAQTSRNEEVETDKEVPAVPFLGEKELGSSSQTPEDRDRRSEAYHEKGLVSSIDEIPKESHTIMVKESMAESALNTKADERGLGVMETNQGECPKFTFEAVQKENAVGNQMGLELITEKEGPIAMMYDMELGWVAEALGPTSGHWKRKARESKSKGKEKELSPV